MYQMKKILLISNKVLHYRSKIYNTFSKRFQALGYELHVLSNDFQNVEFETVYKKHLLEFDVYNYSKKINELKPAVVIYFLHLKDKIILPLILYCRLKKIPCIYWGHGINLQEKENKLKHQVFKLIHKLSNAIIIYTPNELKYILKSKRPQTFIAYNTLDFSSVNLHQLRPKEEVKSKYGIKEDFLILYISRVLPYKGLDILMEIMPGLTDIGLVIVGPGISHEQMEVVSTSPNIYYLGEKYNSDVDEIFNAGDVFSTPGHIGLALNQSFFWGKPVLILDKNHAPEIYYMRNGETGFICKNEDELRQKLILLKNDRSLLAKFSANAKKVAESEMSMDRMFCGFLKAIESVERQPKQLLEKND